eukprot:scaffold1483_cov374-Pavlova_lutheri.AAC.19
MEYTALQHAAIHGRSVRIPWVWTWWRRMGFPFDFRPHNSIELESNDLGTHRRGTQLARTSLDNERITLEDARNQAEAKPVAVPGLRL